MSPLYEIKDRENWAWRGQRFGTLERGEEVE